MQSFGLRWATQHVRHEMQFCKSPPWYTVRRATVVWMEVGTPKISFRPVVCLRTFCVWKDSLAQTVLGGDPSLTRQTRVHILYEALARSFGRSRYHRPKFPQVSYNLLTKGIERSISCANFSPNAELFRAAGVHGVHVYSFLHPEYQPFSIQQCSSGHPSVVP
jgi:hypothetical protein